VFYHSTLEKPVGVWFSLTDKGLAALLKRVNAREITCYLDLARCNKICGSGLAPLCHSCVEAKLNASLLCPNQLRDLTDSK
jgi:ABC-type transporter Mla MlaB component